MPWGVKVLRYEIQSIEPVDDKIRLALQEQASAERLKRAAVLHSEGERISAINLSEGKQIATINVATGNAKAVVLNAHADAERIQALAKAEADGIREVAAAVTSDGGAEAVNQRLATKYTEKMGNVLEKANTVVVPANAVDVAGMVSAGLSIFGNLSNQTNPAANATPQP